MRYLKHKKTGDIFPYTDWLAESSKFEVYEPTISLIMDADSDYDLTRIIIILQQLPESIKNKETVEEILDMPISSSLFKKALSYL